MIKFSYNLDREKNFYLKGKKTIRYIIIKNNVIR